MESGIRLRTLWEMRRWMVLCAAVALLAAVWSVAKVSVLPPGLSSRSLEMATASTQVMLDTPRSTLLDIRQDTYGLEALTNRAVLLGNVMASPPVRAAAAQRAGVPFRAIEVVPPLTPRQPRPVADADTERGTGDILKLSGEYRLVIRANPTVPVLDVYAQTPTADSAEALANAAVEALQAHLTDLAGAAQTPDDELIRLVQLGRAQGTVVNGGIAWQVAVFAFLLTFAVCCGTAMFFRRMREGWRVAGAPARPVAS
jgi:hypothetical protein